MTTQEQSLYLPTGQEVDPARTPLDPRLWEGVALGDFTEIEAATTRLQTTLSTDLSKQRTDRITTCIAYGAEVAPIETNLTTKFLLTAAQNMSNGKLRESETPTPRLAKWEGRYGSLGFGLSRYIGPLAMLDGRTQEKGLVFSLCTVRLRPQ
jgi:hypothetical protein